MLGEPVQIEVFVNGQPIGQPFEATELNVTESRDQLLIQAKRDSPVHDLPSVGGATGTKLDGYFGNV